MFSLLHLSGSSTFYFWHTQNTYPLHTGLPPWQQSSQNMKLTYHLHLTQVMRMYAAVSFYFSHMPSWHGAELSQGAPLSSYATFINMVFTSSLMFQSTFHHCTYLKTYICACHLAVTTHESCCDYVETVLAFLPVMSYLCQQNQQPVNHTQQMFMNDF